MVVIPGWAIAGVMLVALVPANLFYDLIWGLTGRTRLKWYLLEAVFDGVAAFLFMLFALFCGMHDMGVAVFGMAGCVSAKSVSMVISGSDGIFSAEPQRVPEWWVYVGSIVIGPLFVLDSAGPIVAYLLRHLI